jgi:epsilon-lactone hydrolase
MTKFYIGNANPEDSDVNPVLADISDFPPIHIHAGSRELLLQDSKIFHERLVQSGLVSEITIWRNMYHGWHLFSPYLPEANALHEILAQSIIAYFDR